jgi:hypothetical protein
LVNGCADASVSPEDVTLETLLKRGPAGCPAAQDPAVLMPVNTDDWDMTISPRVLGDLEREKKWVSHGVN